MILMIKWQVSWVEDLKLCKECVRMNANEEKNEVDRVGAFMICLEDRRYYSHPGYDLFSIIRAATLHLFGKKAGGASTIEQQLVRTITNDKRRSIVRKIKEIAISREISKSFEKNTLVNVYLDIAYFGYNIIGASQASEYLFDKTRNELSASEAATIASFLLCPIPCKITPFWLARVAKRARYAQTIALDVLEGKSIGIWSIYLKFRPTLASLRLKTVLESTYDVGAVGDLSQRSYHITRITSRPRSTSGVLW